MKSQTIYLPATIISAIRSERAARAFVWSVWLIMLLVALITLARYGRNIPLVEDWLTVPVLTGNEPHLLNWLWAQNNEHRDPLGRLILLLLLKLAGGDFRVGMLFNIIVLALLSFAMIQAARRLRGGRTSLADAFFPVILLHLGNWPNLFWSWQIAFITPTTLLCILLLIFINHQPLITWRTAFPAGICLILLPLSTAIGLIFVPPLTLWFGYCGLLHWRAAKLDKGRRWIGVFLIESALIAIALTGLYFVGYERPGWRPPNPGLIPSLWAALQFLALGFGPISRNSWGLSTTAAVAILLPSTIVVILGILSHHNLERHRALGITVFFGGIGGLALAMGWGRATAIEGFGGWPLHYVLLAAIALCTAFFIWELYGPAKLRTVVQMALFLLICFLVPFNTIHGLDWGTWYRNGMDAVSQDLAAGVPRSVLAQRHHQFLLHMVTPDELANFMSMLHKQGIGPFAQMKDDSEVKPTVTLAVKQPPPDGIDTSLVTSEFHYSAPEAAEVFLAWGINGWNQLPAALHPLGTKIKNKVMHTPMLQEGNTFVARVQTPAGVTIDYGFLITKKRDGTVVHIWEANGEQDYHLVATAEKHPPEQGTDHFPASPLVTQEIRYYLPEANTVFFVWGVNGWKPLPKELHPAGTEIKNNTMRTPMIHDKDAFVTNIQVPLGATINYGFFITDRSGIFDLVQPVWDNHEAQIIALKDSLVEIKSERDLDEGLKKVFNFRPYLLPGIGLFLALWVLTFLLLGWMTQ